MTLALRYAIRSDVGLLREGNEDSAYAGPHLLAIADGMGGHAAGEVASAVAISALAPLDHDMPAAQMLNALAEAVAQANSTLHEMSIADPAVEGMGTTLTALLWSGAEVAVCHIGDSRAYLLREGILHQITTDHTLVQSLVDEGRLSAEAAASHPQRSLVMRALQSSTEAEPDLSMREAMPGDRYLLCSDGLSDVVSEETLHKTLTQQTDPDKAVLQLIELANRSGGPDNITCIVADVVDTATGPLAPSERSMIVGAASNGGSSRTQIGADSPAGRAHRLTRGAASKAASDGGRTTRAAAAEPAGGATLTRGWPEPGPDGQPGPDASAGEDEDDEDGGGAGRRRWPVVTSILVILVVVIAGSTYAAWRYTQGQYYVGADAGHVTIYRGVNQQVAGLQLSHVLQRTDIPLAGVSTADADQVRGTIPASSLPAAQTIVLRLRRSYACQQAFAAVERWQANKPKPPPPPKSGSKHQKPAPAIKYPPEPKVPGYCSAQLGGAP